MTTHVLRAQVREPGRKGAVRDLRAQGSIPAVIYGLGQAAEAVSVNAYDVMMAEQNGHFYTKPQTLTFADGSTIVVLVRDLQREPVFDKKIHIDFMRYDAAKDVRVMVDVRIVDEDQCPGLKAGGVLSMVASSIELICRADSIPDCLEVSIAGVDIGHSVHLSGVTLPKGLRSAHPDRDFTIATVLSTRSSNTGGEAAAE